MPAKKTIYCLASATMLLTGLSKSASAAIIEQTFANFHATFDSVTLPLGGQQVTTGVISASQDPNLPSIVTFNTDTNQTTFDLHFLLDFPLLTSLGLESIPISPFETGSYIVDGQDLITDVTGQGLVSGSSPFAGINASLYIRGICKNTLTS